MTMTDSSHHSMTMKMYFHAGYMEQILFENWMPMTVGPFIGSWFAIFVIAILYEGLKTFREYLLRREARREFTETENRRNAL
ncbi:unnamed protein product [Didymodactylos carnosus]|uniref:Copper transport protein n=1 Tax=Didymodactylos carnosus TaxID=1234261 RepID=A0A8S2S8I4_9BILA|nr:unnamed protein product [Didymodactylos carnosus]CAF4211799.1 unnamed protein product [Didymodactylos carnosus]